MRKANRNTRNDLIARRLAEARMHPYDRERAMHVLESAQRFAEAILWVKERVEGFAASFLKPGLKH